MVGVHVLDVCLEVENDPKLVAAVRAFASTTLAEWELDRFREDAIIVVSELAANAVLHARTPMRLRLQSDGLSFVRIEMYDDNPRQPTLTPPPVEAASGRGLPLVSALASSWGIQSEGDGKTVWAQLGVRPARLAECVTLPGVINVDDGIDAAPSRAEITGPGDPAV